jgi:HSP20 family protein
MYEVNNMEFWMDESIWNYEYGKLEPLYEIYESNGEIIIRIDLPCVQDKSDIQVNVTEYSVNIEAKIGRIIQYEKWGTFQRSIRFCKYSKTIRLPVRIDPKSAKARFKNGILEIHLTKKEQLYTIPIE